MWRALCLLTLMSALLAVTGLLWALPPLWQAIAAAPGMAVALLISVASYSDWSASREASMRR